MINKACKKNHISRFIELNDSNDENNLNTENSLGNNIQRKIKYSRTA